ncbi:phospholipid carrier-dependent glycosyltransferase [Lactobacillus halodurans]|uniref:Phospholipid carrier-dependent glycosyltransferase n=1 Tax=Companilactobacillus halodurans TaxID=2584183 RepID=A0A5P0ZN12_9LACO|nr:glycosyltransferase family 39 protein [Companilactobacillus halodurans]MQS75588.1 phospholipid carrier-dependent glycosyltransferase [Companilactobacillus halodurans]
MNSKEPSRVQNNKKSHFLNKLRTIKYDYWLIAILILAAFLYAWNIWEAGEANNFYTAAVVSMTKSFKNFWYASFDPAGFITVDKPPVALWFMTISAKIFGVHGWSVVLPSILFGIGSVYLIYNLISKRFGRIPARIAALIMTLTPIVVADSRTNNMDATLIFFLLLSFWFVQKAVLKQQQRYLWIGFALIGFSFNIKMLQAFMVLPALYLYYWLAAQTNWKKKLAHLSIATIFLAVFTLFWPLSVDLTNSSNRPYEGGSETNSALELAFGYNGTQRLLGQTTGTGGAFPGMGNSSKKNGKSMTPPSGKKSKKPSGTKANKSMTPPSGSKKSAKGNPPAMPNSNKKSGSKTQAGNAPKMAGGKTGNTGNAPTGGGTGGGGSGAFNIGTAGPFRLLQKELGPQISWLMLIALFGLVSSYAYFRGSKMKKWYSLNSQRTELWLWIGWLVPVAGFFSIASFFHPYYMIMLAPAIAALAGVGIYTMVKQWREKSFWSMLLPLSILSTSILQAWYLNNYYPTLSWVLLIAGIIISIPLFVLPWIAIKLKNKRAWPIAALIIVLLAPTWWSLTPTLAGSSDGIPSAGPSLLTALGNGGGMGDSQVDSTLLTYLEKHQGKAEYLFATDDSSTASPYIIATGKAVMAMGGFNGTDKAITLSQFKKLVKEGKLKYYYSGGKTGGSNNEIVSWIKKHAKKVNLKTKNSITGSASSVTVSTKTETKTIPQTPSQNNEDSSSTPPTKPSGSNKQPQNGQGPSGQAPSGQKPSGNKKPSGKKMTKSQMKKLQKNMKQPGMKEPSSMGQGQGGPGQSGTLYDLSSIYK